MCQIFIEEGWQDLSLRLLAFLGKSCLKIYCQFCSTTVLFIIKYIIVEAQYLHHDLSPVFEDNLNIQS